MPKKPSPPELDKRPTARLSPEPPLHAPVAPEARPYFDAILSEMPKKYWTAHTLARASMLAAHMQMLATENQLLTDEGTIIAGKRGMQRNPRVEVVTQLQRLVTTVSRSMALDARTMATAGMKGRGNLFTSTGATVEHESATANALASSDLLAARGRA